MTAPREPRPGDRTAGSPIEQALGEGTRPAAEVAGALPLPLRLPNPPAIFAGRAAEARSIRDAVRRAPVTVITGDAGLGKSALALSVIHGAFAERVASTIFISLRGRALAEPLALVVARALVQADGLAPFDWSALLGSAEALGAAAIDVADARGRWILLDDLHHADAAEVGALLARTARYARRSRWIATTRSAPPVEDLGGQVLPLGPMKDADLARLARALIAPGAPAAVRRVIAFAAGSPARVRQALTEDEAAAPGAEALPLAPATIRFAQALALVGVPVPEPLVLSLLPDPGESLEALEQQSLIERTAPGVRLHDLARAALPPPEDSREWRDLRIRAGSALARAKEPALALRGLALLLGAGRPDEVAAALGSAGEDLLARGYAASLWKILEDAAPAAPSSAGEGGGPSRSLEHWRLRCAVVLGDAAVLSKVRPPGGDEPEVRLLWAELQLAGGRLEEAARVAAALASAAGSDANRAFRAGLVHARCLLNGGHIEEGLARSTRSRPRTSSPGRSGTRSRPRRSPISAGASAPSNAPDARSARCPISPGRCAGRSATASRGR
ncbi:MAG: hypothetical protein QM820_07645 [Minicystis sp.]